MSKIKSMLPFILGVLIGGGFSKNPYIHWIIISYVILMVVFNLVKGKIVKVKDSVDKKTAIKEQAWETVQDVGEATLKGNQIGANWFDNFYKDGAFYLGFSLFASIFVLAMFQLWLWVLVNVLGLIFFTVLNQVQRSIRELKEYHAEKDRQEKDGLQEVTK